jgi:eukaryotic-like serine/threonine-protein kinase
VTETGRLSPQRWRQADEILGFALETPSAERAAFVARACADDPELMREVEALLAADAQAGAFLDPPRASRAAAETTGALSRSSPRVLPSRTILAERYRIEEHVGNGGMGAVYRARDLLLETDVAIKVLMPQLLAPAGRMEAFRREVRLARLVTHPNVCRVHDIV